MVFTPEEGPTLLFVFCFPTYFAGLLPRQVIVERFGVPEMQLPCISFTDAGNVNVFMIEFSYSAHSRIISVLSGTV